MKQVDTEGIWSLFVASEEGVSGCTSGGVPVHASRSERSPNPTKAITVSLNADCGVRLLRSLLDDKSLGGGDTILRFDIDHTGTPLTMRR